MVRMRGTLGRRWLFLLVGVWFALRSAQPQTTTVSLNPEADAFIRDEAPAANYGRAGSLSVGGASAPNGFNLPGGRTDSIARFQLSGVVASLDGVFGNHDWFIVSASLRVYEIAAPNNALFSRGLGTFTIGWLAAGDVWQEGTGSPSAPTTDGISFHDLPMLLDPAHDLSLGTFTNKGVDGSLVLPLLLFPPFLEDIRAGDVVTLQFTPADDTIGFTFLSRSDPRTDLRLSLELTAAASPPPRISAIERFAAGKVAIRFATRSNWTHILQSRNDFPRPPAADWFNEFTLSPAPSNGQSEVFLTTTNEHGFYRLLVHP